MMNAMPLSPNASLDMHLNPLEFPFPGSPIFSREDGLAMFRHGSKEGTKRKQSAGPGVWDVGVQDFYGFLDVPADMSLQDRVSTKGNLSNNPPTKHQRLEQVPPSLPGDSNADFLCFGTSSCGETAEDKLDKIRAKNRQAQERFRAKKKAEEKAIQDHMNKMKNEIALTQQEVAMKKQLALSLGARGVAASTQLAHVHSQLSQLSVSKFTSRRTSSSSSTPARKSLPLTAWMTSKFGNPSHAHAEENADVFMPALDNTCSPIFQANSTVPRPCNSFKYQERISLRHISTVPGSSALARTKHYKASVAHRLGCAVTDICWRMDSVRVPELTGPDGMSTHFGTIECAPKLFLAFICSLIEYSASLLLLARLEQDMDVFSCEDNLDAAPFSTGKLQYAVPPVQRTTSDCSDSTSTNTFHRLDDAFTSAMGLEPATEVPGPVEWSSPTESSDAQTTELLALSIFPKLLTSYISRMHPDDAAGLCVQLSTLVQHFHAPAEDPKLDEFTSLVNSKIFAIMKSLDAAVQHAQLGLASKSMYKPLTKEATKREITRIHRTIKDVTTEWHFILLMSQMDAGRQIRTMALQICNPVSNGYVKFEEQNVKAYAAINMTFEQKQELAFVWDVFKQESAQVGKQRESICQMLASLPNSKDLHVEDMRAMKANLVALAAKDKQAKTTPTSDTIPKNTPDATEPLTNAPSAENKINGEAAVGNCEWVQKLIGVSPEVTEIAENALIALHDMQKRQTELYSEIGEVYMNVLTPKQNAVWLTVLMPSLGDVFRVAEMATTDVRQKRMFNNNIGSLVHNPDEAATRARERALLCKVGLDNPLPLPLK